MQQSDFQRFKAVMAGMGELYQRDVSGPLLDVYWLALRNWDLSDFEQAASHLLQQAQFMPRPADFTALQKAARPTYGEAWLKAVNNAGSAIVCGQVTFGKSCGDPLIDRAVHAIGGYGVIAMTDRDKLCFVEKRFAEHYESMQDAEDVREAVPQIAGTFKPRLDGGEGPKPIRDLLKRLA